MTPSSVKASYLRALTDRALVRRYTGAGSVRPHFDVSVRVQVVGYAPHELVGTIVQGDRRAILYADDLLGVGWSGGITTADKLVVRGKELAVIAADDSTRRIDGVLIAYELQVRG